MTNRCVEYVGFPGLAFGGIGASGLNFFLAGFPETIAGSLQMALEMLASDDFAPAFANSTDPMDYAWGKLHRIVFNHSLGADPFNVPNGGGFMDLAPGLPGLRQIRAETTGLGRRVPPEIRFVQVSVAM